MSFIIYMKNDINKNQVTYCLKAKRLFISVFPYVVIAFVTYFYLSFYKQYLPSPTEDEGMFPYRAYQILHGKVLYKDIGAILFPGNYYFLALIYKLFGYGFTVTRELVLIIDTFINLLVYAVSKMIIKKWFAIVPPLLFLIYGFPAIFGYNHYMNSMALFLIAMIYFYNYLKKKTYSSLCLSGLFTGLTMVFLQSKGFLAAGAFIFILFTNKDKNGFKAILWFVIGMLFALIPTFGYIAAKGAFTAFIQNELIAQQIYKGLMLFSMHMLFNGITYSGRINIILLASVFSLIGIVSLSLLIFKKDKKPEQNILFAGSAVLFLNTIQRIIFTPEGLILINSVMAIVFSVWLIKLFLDHLKPRLWTLIYNAVNGFISIGIIVVIIAIGIKLYTNINEIRTNAYRFTVNGTALWTKDKQMGRDLAVFAVKTKQIMGADHVALVYPYSPILYTLLKLESPSKYDVLIKVGNNEGTPDSVLRDTINRLKNMPVKFVITYDWGPDTFKTVSKMLGMKYMPDILNRYIIRHYTPVFRINGFVLRKRMVKSLQPV